MAEFKLYKGPHWMDALTEEEIDAYVAKSKSFLLKYRCRYRRGDIVSVREDGFYDNRAGWGKHAFYLLKIPGVSKAAAKAYTVTWDRDVEVSRTLNDTTNHIYEYSAIITQTSISGNELFKDWEFTLGKLPVDVTVVTRTPQSVTLRLEPLNYPGVIAGKITPIERRDYFQTAAKNRIGELTRTIRRRKFRILAEDVPQSIKDKFANDEAVTVTMEQIQAYLQNRSVA